MFTSALPTLTPSAIPGKDLNCRSPSQLDVARSRRTTEPTGIRPTVTVGDAQPPPWTDSSGDAAARISGVIFASDIARGLAEMTRVTNSSGTLCVTTWSTNAWSAALRYQAAHIGDGITELPTPWSTGNYSVPPQRH
ncbi:class I SAM-dependent methyltransferase [Rhodococcus sp. 27YEA15]|uniref:class I SAM-dependent methyltransferase n=1 Tax=Rhodococcus sp. 27YEA15 TaxID=3156259 RepID=UPI003C7CC511